MIEVIQGGIQTTIQDGGRPGHLSRGIPPAGAQDYYALALGNLLVGNDLTPPPLSVEPPGHAGLEMLLRGPTLRFTTDAAIALTGADMAPTLDGKPVPMLEAVLVRAGQVLAFGYVKRGARGYLAIAGGIDVPLYLKSRATYIRGSQGGLEGRALKAGDRLKLGASAALTKMAGRRLPSALAPWPDEPNTIRVVLGPQDFMFTPKGIETFLAVDWKLSPVSDRMGMRLIGPKLDLFERPAHLVRDAGSGPADIVDDVIPVGGIQVPGGIEPIVMGVENPTAGGYAKIATVISSDLGKIGQLTPGSSLRFRAIEAADAADIARRQWAALKRAAKEMRS
ncbi:MAG: biotin-dependent carboxyltransferase [Alphaproteobacteria bacterium]|nr:biotin-dependent carboxyltransferase [Alphaproteobacteria bacterium]